MSVTVRLDMAPLEAAARLALQDTVSDYLDVVDELFNDEVWGWPNLTKRSSGEIAGTVRDVVDTGKLADPANRNVGYGAGGLSAVVEWTAPYAAAVFVGAVFKTRALSLPARNVPRAALERLDTGATFAQHLARRLR